MGVLYRLVFPNGKSYIGITTRAFSVRWKAHRGAQINKRTSGFALYRAWALHGEPLPQILAIVEDKDLYESERRAVAVFDTFGENGYNMTPGGEISPTSVPAIAAKLCRPKSRESVEKTAAAHRGMKRSPETCKKFSEMRKGKGVGRKRSPESVEKGASKIRGKPSGQIMSEKHRRNVSIMASRPKSDETKRKMSDAAKGKPKSEEARKNMSIAAKRRHENNSNI